MKNFALDPSKRIFVTGGTGMLGSYLLRYLVELGAQNVLALRRKNSSMDLAGEVADAVQWVEGDLLDLPLLESAMEGTAQVYHCAALISLNPADFDRMKRVNVEGTANMVNVALASGVEKFMHVSSTSAVGRSQARETLNERNTWQRGRYNTSYGISKFLAEQEVWRAQVEGLNTVIVNPAVILGGGRWAEGPLRIFPLLWKRFPFYSTGLNGFVDVRDVARFMVRLMESPTSGERYILSAENLSFKELMGRIADHLERPRPQLPFSPWLRELTWRALLPLQQFGLAQTISRESVRIASRHYYMDNSKSLAHFPDFAYTPLAETLRATARAFRISAEEGASSRVLPLRPY